MEVLDKEPFFLMILQTGQLNLYIRLSKLNKNTYSLQKHHFHRNSSLKLYDSIPSCFRSNISNASTLPATEPHSQPMRRKHSSTATPHPPLRRQNSTTSTNSNKSTTSNNNKRRASLNQKPVSGDVTCTSEPAKKSADQIPFTRKYLMPITKIREKLSPMRKGPTGVSDISNYV